MINCVAMLTRNDITVPNALDVVKKNCHASAEYWGFKDVGVTFEQGEALIREMQAAGKHVAIEPLTRDEETANKWADIAIKYHIDAFLGRFFKSVSKKLNDAGILYFPPFGRRDENERLFGTIEELKAEAMEILDQGSSGIRISAFRWLEGDPEVLTMALKELFDEKKVPFMMTGSINDFEKLDFVKKVQPWGITVGGALFDDGKFGGGTVAERVDRIDSYCNG